MSLPTVKATRQFMNAALNLNPVMLLTVPYSTLGTGLIILPTKDPNQAIISLFLLSSTGQASTSGFDDLDGNNLTVAGEGRVRTDFFGLTGHQLFGATFSNRKFTSIDQNARFVFENGALEGKKGSWNIYYNFDQYLYEPKKGRAKASVSSAASALRTAIPISCILLQPGNRRQGRYP